MNRIATTESANKCSTCVLGQFCLPVGLNSEEIGKIDSLVTERVRLKKGDVLYRQGEGFAYHLAVVVDDAFQGVTEVTRGADLLPATPLQVTLQHLLGLPTPTYHHHRLITDDTGKRLAKRDDARALSKYRAEGATPADIRRLVGL